MDSLRRTLQASKGLEQEVQSKGGCVSSEDSRALHYTWRILHVIFIAALYQDSGALSELEQLYDAAADFI